jgi:hypothetical protein
VYKTLPLAPPAVAVTAILSVAVLKGRELMSLLPIF